MEIRGFFVEVLGITNENLLEELCNIAVMTKIKKGTLLVQKGEIQTYISFLVDGVFRGYYESSDGKEVTDCFGYICGQPAMASYDLESPTVTNLVAETDSTCVRFSIADIKRLLEKYTELVYVYNQLLMKDMERHLRIKQIMYEYDAMGRYQWFLEAYPGLIDIVNHKNIASFIGITPVSLSRVRRKLRGGGGTLSEKKSAKE